MDRTASVLYKSNMLKASEILNYNLFGEVRDLPDVVHCETIEARSRLHDWEFAPHRHARLYQVLLLQSGAGQASLDGREHSLAPMTMVNVPIGLVHAFKFMPGTVGFVVTLAAEIVDAVLQPAEGLHLALAQPATFAADDDCVETMEAIAATFAGRDFARAQILRSLAGLLLARIAQSIAYAGPADSRATAPEILVRFEALLERHYAEHWSVADYARALAVSPTHLSRLARQATGRPATRLIEERIVREARRNLIYTNLSISTIAYSLGYRDPAYFSRVFARATGLAPSKFRAGASQPDR